MVGVQILSPHGAIALFQTTGLTGDLNGSDGSLSFSGTLNNINAALNGMTFDPVDGYSGWAQVFVACDDKYQWGENGGKRGFAKVDIDVGGGHTFAADQLPVVAFTGSPTTYENTPLAINTLSISDPDSPGGTQPVGVVLSTSHGFLTLGQRSNLIFYEGDGIDDQYVRFMGTINNVNSALASLVFVPDVGYTGTDAKINMACSDFGFSGLGFSGDSTNHGVYQQIDITVNAGESAQPNDAPAIAAPGFQTVRSDFGGSLTFSLAEGNRISISDSDALAGDIFGMRLFASHGTITLDMTGSPAITFITGVNGTADMRISGTIAARK